jgi:hypothetical protein
LASCGFIARAFLGWPFCERKALRDLRLNCFQVEKEFPAMTQFQKTAHGIRPRLGLALVAVLFLTAAPARADIILTLVQSIPVGNAFEYTYSVMLTDGTALRAGGAGMNTANFFTVYDIPGLISGSETYGGVLATNSSHTEQTMGLTPATEHPFPAETGSLMNVTTFWTGPDVTGGLALGTFSFLSTDPLGSAMLAFTGASQNGQNMGLIANNSGEVAGPAASPSPEPRTLLLVAIGLVVVGGLRYWRRV